MYDKQRIRETKLQIRRVFLEEWDPIGVADEPLAQDECDSYLGGTYDLLERDVPEAEIASRLYFIETVGMGMGGQSKDKLLTVAKSLKRIPI